MTVNRQLCKECKFVKDCDIEAKAYVFPACHTPATEDDNPQPVKDDSKCPTPK